jgi:hypothetical protein
MLSQAWFKFIFVIGYVMGRERGQNDTDLDFESKHESWIVITL